ncbi:hypothetical protein QOZ80_3BG0286530 [Eleusine coracana subsp. coracana]|nr:hypothetical protein QOZ80_3BG0286530 [Eleusine coracana subsp. coracana]
MYNAGDLPSLQWVPPPHPGSMNEVREFGIIPCGYGCHYRLVALCDGPSDYQLQIYCSETETWSARTLLNPCPGVKIVPEKVVKLVEGALCWVDFSCGLLTCDLRQEPPCAHFIPFPVPLPENRGRLKKASEPGVSARWFRDLICVDGVLKFVEMEYHFIESEKPIDPSDKETLLDEDLILSLKHRNMDEKEKTRDGWRAMIWTREFSSNCWSKRRTYVHDKDAPIPVWEYCCFPTLCPDGDGVLYLKSMDPSGKIGRIFTLDLGSKEIMAIERRLVTEHCTFRLCTLSKHMEMNPGIFSACLEITKGRSFANGLRGWPNFLRIKEQAPTPTGIG